MQRIMAEIYGVFNVTHCGGCSSRCGAIYSHLAGLTGAILSSARILVAFSDVFLVATRLVAEDFVSAKIR